MVWFGDAILFPPTTTVPAPHKEMPSPASETYLEAAGIVDASPRAAAALVRLALEELCLALGVEGGLNDAIKALVKRGMRSDVQKALDVVRVSGNRAIHPGTIDTSDTREIATAMFALLNMIVDDQIARPKELAAMYEALPEAVKGQIQRRDGRTAEKDAKSSGSTGSSETV